MTEPGLAAPAAPTGTVEPTGTAEPTSTAAPTSTVEPTGTSAPRPATRWMQRLAEETSPTPPDAETRREPDGAADDQDDVDDAEPGSARPLATGFLFLLGLLWLSATMWTAHAAIVGSAVDVGVLIGTTALALPSVIAASLFAGAAAGLAGSVRFALGAGRLRRGVVGVGAGALTGLAAGGAILFAYGVRPSVAVLAITVGAAGAIAGAAALVNPPTLAAGLAATLGVFVVGVVINYFQSPLKSIFGAGDSVPSQVDAARTLSFSAAVLSGVVAGMIAFLYRRRRDTGTRWPAYLLAGGMPGLLFLFAEALTLVGGARLLDLLGEQSQSDLATVQYLDTARLNQALVVGFVGAIVATIAVGRTLRRPDPS